MDLPNNQLKAWVSGDLVQHVPRCCGEVVIIRHGTYQGQLAVLVDLEAISPEPVYCIEIAGQHMLVKDADIEPINTNI